MGCPSAAGEQPVPYATDTNETGKTVGCVKPLLGADAPALDKAPHSGNGQAESKTEMPSFHYASMHTNVANGHPLSFTEVLKRLRDSAASDRIHVHDVATSPAVRQACDTFTSEHPEFQRQFIDNGSGRTLLFERRASK